MRETVRSTDEDLGQLAMQKFSLSNDVSDVTRKVRGITLYVRALPPDDVTAAARETLGALVHDLEALVRNANGAASVDPPTARK